MMYLWLIVGFILLIKGADFFVEGSSSVAKLLRIPSIIIGLTIVAMGTTAPEAAVSLAAGIQGQNEIAISNVIGSNIFNLMVVVGVCACIKPITVTRDLLKRDYPISIGATILLLVMLADSFIFRNSFNTLSRINGITLLILFIMYMILLVRSTIKSRAAAADEDDIPNYSALKSVMLILIGGAGIVLGGDLVVDSASEIASAFGLSSTLIGLTIVACGTSLPELVTSIVASRKGENDLALGNVVGSNIFNLMFVLGLSSTASPIVADPLAIYDLLVLLFFNAVILIMTIKSDTLKRYNGFIMLAMYIIYMAYIIMR